VTAPAPFCSSERQPKLFVLGSVAANGGKRTEGMWWGEAFPNSLGMYSTQESS